MLIQCRGNAEHMPGFCETVARVVRGVYNAVSWNPPSLVGTCSMHMLCIGAVTCLADSPANCRSKSSTRLQEAPKSAYCRAMFLSWTERCTGMCLHNTRAVARRTTAQKLQGEPTSCVCAYIPRFQQKKSRGFRQRDRVS